MKRSLQSSSKSGGQGDRQSGSPVAAAPSEGSAVKIAASRRSAPWLRYHRTCRSLPSGSTIQTIVPLKASGKRSRSWFHLRQLYRLVGGQDPRRPRAEQQVITSKRSTPCSPGHASPAASTVYFA